METRTKIIITAAFLVVISVALLCTKPFKFWIRKFAVGDCIIIGEVENWSTPEYIIERVGNKKYLTKVIAKEIDEHFEYTGKFVTIQSAELNFSKEEHYEKIDCKGATLEN